jgi:ribosome-binding ATPase
MRSPFAFAYHSDYRPTGVSLFFCACGVHAPHAIESAPMKVAIVGLPQAGKRTLFTLLTGRSIPASRRPEEPVEGVAAVRDPRVDALARLCRPEKTTYAENRFVLAPDMPYNEHGRGWLEAVRKCDLVCLVVRAFVSDAVYHPADSVNAERDRRYLQSELLLADMEIADKRLQRLDKEKRAGLRPDQKIEESALRKCMAALEDGRPACEAALEEHESAALRSLELVSALPVLCVFNVSESDLKTDFGPRSLAVSCQIEAEIMAIEDPGERSAFLQAAGLESSGLDRMNTAVYDALGLMSFYTQGPDECRAWTIRKGDTAPVAGGKIHKDIQKGFIRVEVIRFEDFVAAGSEEKARESGKVQTRGRDYAMQDGDICHFLQNV